MSANRIKLGLSNVLETVRDFGGELAAVELEVGVARVDVGYQSRGREGGDGHAVAADWDGTSAQLWGPCRDGGFAGGR